MSREWEEDEWEERDFRRGFGYVRGGGGLVPPGAAGHSSMRRSRSHGQHPAPNVYVYTSQRNEVDERSPSPNPRGRTGQRTDEILGKLDDIDRDIRKASRSRGRSDAAWGDPSPYNRELQLELTREREDKRYLEERLRDFDRSKEYGREKDAARLDAAERRWALLEEQRRLDGDYHNRLEREEELMKKKAELRRLKDRIEREESDNRLKAKDAEWKKEIEVQRMKEEQKLREAEIKRKEERERIVAERDKEERVAKEERKRIKLEIEAKERDEEEERKRIFQELQSKEAKRKKDAEESAAKAVSEWERKKADKKREEEELRARFRAEEEEKKRKEKDEEEKWKLKIKMREEEEKAKKKAEEAKVEEEMARKLSQFGFQNNQIQAMMHPKQVSQLPIGAAPGRPVVTSSTALAVLPSSRTPTYIKVHRDHIDVETLRYFGLPWEYDTVRQSESRPSSSANSEQANPDYVIILHEMDERETDILFEHTRKLRRGSTQMLIEDRGRDRHGHPEYAFVRRRRPSASPSRRKSSPKRVSLLSLV